MQVHDIGLHLKRHADGGLGFAVYVGGGMGRTPIIAKKIRDFLPEADLLSYLEAILRVYNLHGRRDNNYKARIKILVHELGVEAFARAGRGGVAAHPRRRARSCREAEIARIDAYFAPPAFDAPAGQGRRCGAPDPRLRPLGRRATRTPTSSRATPSSPSR